MECILEGHTYSLKNYVCDVQIIEFMEKEKGEITQDGVTNEEVLEMLIARMQYLNKTLPCRENSIVITKLEEALMWLNILKKSTVGTAGSHAQGEAVL